MGENSPCGENSTGCLEISIHMWITKKLSEVGWTNVRLTSFN